MKFSLFIETKARGKVYGPATVCTSKHRRRSFFLKTHRETFADTPGIALVLDYPSMGCPPSGNLLWTSLVSAWLFRPKPFLLWGEGGGVYVFDLGLSLK
jgi:hypothetical protein